jgi:hypothetical protein
MGHVQVIEALNAFTVPPGQEGQHMSVVEPERRL